MQILIFLFISSLVTLFVIQIAALQFLLYWKYLWLDIPMHLLGGVTTALGLSVYTYGRNKTPHFFSSILGYACFAFCIGVLWEVFELVVGFSIVDEYFIFDTFLDLCMDVLGGGLGYGIVRSIKQIL